jgi:hypothetical protein
MALFPHDPVELDAPITATVVGENRRCQVSGGTRMLLFKAVPLVLLHFIFNHSRLIDLSFPPFLERINSSGNPVEGTIGEHGFRPVPE